MRKGTRQEVIGIVVNQQLGIDRNKLRQFRALLHQLQTKDMATVQWGSGNLTSSIIGYANFVKMVKPALGVKLQQQIDILLQTQRLHYPEVTSNPANNNSCQSTPQQNGNAKKKDDDKPWWNVL